MISYYNRSPKKNWLNNPVFIFILLFLIFTNVGYSQSVHNLSVQFTLKDKESKLPLKGVSIVLEGLFQKYENQSNDFGIVILNSIPSGDYRLKLSHIGYDGIEQLLSLTKDQILLFELTPKSIELNEVVVTATESRGMTSTSIIDKRAMQHLQPSSFTDLLELLPGGRSKDPIFNASNHIKLREVGTADSNYDISSLGTAFVIDGIPINTDANLQYTTGPKTIITSGSSYANTRRNTTSKGIDMRSISTDQIEKVEIIRGIPSVEYGDLTSGLIKIKRKRGRSNWESRFKADEFSKLYYVGKGFESEEKSFVLNVGLDYLDAKSDPRNSFENYKRITASIRAQKTWENDAYLLQWDSSLDYSGSMDNEKADPNVGYAKIDRYTSSYNRLALANTFDLNFKSSSFIKALNVSTSFSQQYDKIEQTKWVQVSSATAIPNTTEQGEHDGIFLTPQYTSDLLVDGKPFDAFLKAMGDFEIHLFGVKHTLKAGIEWTYAKNNGKGQVYDTTHPPSPEMTTRPRSYRDIPASTDIAFFAEDAITIPLGQHQLNIAGGLRAMSLLNIPSAYAIHGKYYFDPRINAQWALPAIQIGQHALKTEFTAGTGQYTKFPTLAQLYPDYVYNDLVQLNYYHNTPEYRRINLMTYKTSAVNYDLAPAINKKWEIRADFSYDNNRFSITYFNERMNSGFRNGSGYHALSYKKYDTNSIDPATLTGPPDLAQMSFVMDTLLTTYNITNNGSRLLKSGIEFQFSSKRFPSINTRFTVNGAWFKSTYTNSNPVYKSGQKDIIINGKRLPYLGLYQWDDGFEKQQLNTNLIVDTYIPSLGLEFSSSFQFMWFKSDQSTPMNGTPISYIDPSGQQHPYLEEDKTDPILQWLNIKYNNELFQKKTIPMSMNMNLKISKDFYKKFRISMFVNRLFSYYQNYEINGQKIEQRGLTSPYFGMELNLNL
ncbi:carboxypeptidase-like regulatory domain-containing protein [Flavobacterium sp. '19STA2R22 D10 B1']|uniref:carboxypeptidase-like regulatory domain-containing protein n=1 Tax=Flavobacterium aerium TaxID=3037261 RepID=UPI00278BC4A0|nr:TonB-dependent receptor plug domain-containing protein [Flavobacterium sp. '19STA2R22 D10 B1']